MAPPRRKRKTQTTPHPPDGFTPLPPSSAPPRALRRRPSAPPPPMPGRPAISRDTSSESDLSHSRNKLLPSPSPVPPLPPPPLVTPLLPPLGWHDDSNQGLVPWRLNGAPFPSSLRSSFPPYSPLLDPSSTGLVGDGEIETGSSQTLPPSSFTQPTSSECLVLGPTL